MTLQVQSPQAATNLSIKVFEYRIEVTFQVRIDHVNIACLKLLADDTQSVVSTSAMTKAS